NTFQGLRTFENARELLVRPTEDIGESRHPAVIWWQGWTAPVVVSGFTVPAALSVSAEEEDSESTAAEVLADLTLPEVAAPRRRQLILTAEVLRFDSDQVAQLEGILRQYVDGHLCSDSRDEQVA